MDNITLYDLMAEDLDVWVSPNKTFGFDLQIDNEKGEELVNEKGVHPYAMEAYADMCRRFLRFYESAKSKCEAA